MPWTPWLGAVPPAHSLATPFRVWAPRAPSLRLHVLGGGRAREAMAEMAEEGDGYRALTLPGVGPGARYFYPFPDGSERPAPASLLQPLGVHGPSEVVDLPA